MNHTFFSGSQKSDVAFGLAPDTCQAKFPQSLSKQETTEHVDTICSPPSELMCLLSYSWRRLPLLKFSVWLSGGHGTDRRTACRV